MSMLSGLWGYIAAALLAIVGAGAAYLKGRKTQKQIAEGVEAKHDLQQANARNETLKSANDVRDSVDSVSYGDVRKRLQDKYSRD